MVIRRVESSMTLLPVVCRLSFILPHNHLWSNRFLKHPKPIFQRARLFVAAVQDSSS